MTSSCKALPVTDRGGLEGCEMLSISHRSDNRLTDGGKVATRHIGRALLPRNIICLILVLVSVRG
jgi:hypothetical protein